MFSCLTGPLKESKMPYNSVFSCFKCLKEQLLGFDCHNVLFGLLREAFKKNVTNDKNLSHRPLTPPLLHVTNKNPQNFALSRIHF